MSIDPTAFIHETAVVDEGSEIGPRVKIWHFCHIMPGAKIGENTSIGQCSYVASDVTIGKNCKIQNSVNIFDGVRIGDNCFLAPCVCFTNVKFPRAFRKGKYENTIIEDGASIGANSTIICGITIGSMTMVGAGSVVTKSLPPGITAFGVPAQIKKSRTK